MSRISSEPRHIDNPSPAGAALPEQQATAKAAGQSTRGPSEVGDTVEVIAARPRARALASTFPPMPAESLGPNPERARSVGFVAGRLSDGGDIPMHDLVRRALAVLIETDGLDRESLFTRVGIAGLVNSAALDALQSGAADAAALDEFLGMSAQYKAAYAARLQEDGLGEEEAHAGAQMAFDSAVADRQAGLGATLGLVDRGLRASKDVSPDEGAQYGSDRDVLFAQLVRSSASFVLKEGARALEDEDVPYISQGNRI